MDIRKVLSYNDVLICPRNSELKHLNDAIIDIKYEGFFGNKIPLINAPMDKVCSPELLRTLHDDFNMPVTIHRWFDNVEQQLDFFKKCDFKYTTENVFLATGIIDKWSEWIKKLLDFQNIRDDIGILIDVANGDTKSCVDTIKYIRNECLGINIMAGNVATKSGFARLQEAGANFIRVGIGGGSICSTRLKTGFGIPTLTSILDCAKVKDSAYLVADGGIEHSGDICKAIAAGADMVMAGKIFAATDLSSGQKFNQNLDETDKEEEYRFVKYSGMASKEAIEKLKSRKSVISIEGVSGFVEYKGKTIDVVNELIGNLKTSLSYYAGCTNWKEFQRKVKLVEITSQGWEESKTRVNLT